MTSIVLYCCTYRRDIRRLALLWESIKKFNQDKIPFFISVPSVDVEFFKSFFQGESIEILDEVDILKSNSRLNLDAIYFENMGKKQQQVIKSEFWRLGIAPNYLVLDSDCLFLRDFGLRDFLVEEKTPYSVVHEGKTLLQFTSRFGPQRVRSYWRQDRAPIQQQLDRPGVAYDYGYAPFLWSSEVWRSLDEEYLRPRGINLWDAIVQNPSEFTWYGESLLKFRAIPIWPRGELFKHYHYENEYWLDKKLRIKEEQIALDYLGVVYQSNWDLSMDYGGATKNLRSRFARQLRRRAKWLKFHLFNS